MNRLRFTTASLTLGLAAFFAMSCGTKQAQNQGPQLQAISLSPTSADAKNYPDGQVPFIATGYYVNPTQTETPQPAIWVACQNSSPSSEVSISTSGVAQCGGSAAGEYSIDAWSWGSGHAACSAISVCNGTCSEVTASANLTCP